MRGHVSWLRAIALANVVVASLVILVLYRMVLALSALAPEISTWQILTLLAIGVPTSLLGLLLASRLGSHGGRCRGLAMNGTAILLYAAIVVRIAFLLIGTTNRRFIVSEGYKGDVYIIDTAANGKLATMRRAGISFRIPGDGSYLRPPIVSGWTRDEYYYERGNGTQHRIVNLWSTTVQRTMENLANDKDLPLVRLSGEGHVLRPALLTPSMASGCRIHAHALS